MFQNVEESILQKMGICKGKCSCKNIGFKLLHTWHLRHSSTAFALFTAV